MGRQSAGGRATKTSSEATRTMESSSKLCPRVNNAASCAGYYQMFSQVYLTIDSCLACVYRVVDARGKFGEHERSVRIARGAAESNSSFLSALQNFPSASITRNTHAKSMNQLFYNFAK